MRTRTVFPHGNLATCKATGKTHVLKAHNVGSSAHLVLHAGLPFVSMFLSIRGIT